MLFTVPRYVTTGGSGRIIRNGQRERKWLRAFSHPNSTETILFDTCALANGWKDEDKIKKFPDFLRERAATHFYTTPVAERATYDAGTKKLKQSPVSAS